MKVKLVTLAAGPAGVILPGQVVTLPDETARALITGGYAVAVGAQTRTIEPEAAALAPPETATLPRPKRKVRNDAPRKAGDAAGT